MMLKNLFSDTERLPDSPRGIKGSNRNKHVHDALLRLGLVRDWGPMLVDNLTKRNYVKATMYALGSESTTYGGEFGLADLREIARELGYDWEHKETKDDLRKWIASRARVEYESGAFTKEQVAGVTMRVVRATHQGER